MAAGFLLPVAAAQTPHSRAGWLVTRRSETPRAGGWASIRLICRRIGTYDTPPDAVTAESKTAAGSIERGWQVLARRSRI